LKKRDVEIVKGEKSHEKVLMIEASSGLTPQSVIEKLKESMES
jgi:uncharacterized protein YggU (UPF0235/DUF167 family)